MKICHVCKAECEDNAELCSVCGADLTENNEAEIKENITEIKNPVLLASMEDVVSAEIFKDILKDNGILYSSDDENEDSAMYVTFGGGLVSSEIYVDSEDFNKAKELYDEFLASDTQFEGDFFDESEDFSNDGE